jgi:dTDP-4-dehydrorhamnose 3,5-epimerase
VLEFKSQIHRDERGYFFEAWKQSAYRQQGLTDELVQLNISRSTHAVLRGLHYQYPNPQGKLVGVLEGDILDIVVDIRSGSPHFGRWQSYRLDAAEGRQIYVPEGFAHGFQVLSDTALVAYMCSREYDPAGDSGIVWNDPDIGIEWPLAPAVMAIKDEQAPRLADIAAARLPVFAAPQSG